MCPSLGEIHEAADRLRDHVSRTSLVLLEPAHGAQHIYLKLENQQRFGSFKVRAATNAIASASDVELAHGVVTASAGNFGQGLAAAARELGVGCTVLAPDTAAQNKLDAMRMLGATVLSLPFEKWWRCLETHSAPDLSGHFIHPVADPAVIAGNATIGLEILEDLPTTSAVLMPVGGGGLAAGVGTAVRLQRPEVRVVAAESEAAAPVAAALAAAKPVAIDYQESFIDGAGGSTVLAQMWPLLQSVLSGAITVSLEEVREVIRRLATERDMVVEGAGALPVAAALRHPDGFGEAVVCVVSGGNIDEQVLQEILGEEPSTTGSARPDDRA